MIMYKKMLLLALAVAALFALPSAASAQEIHFKNVTTFTGTGGAGSISILNEPKVSFTAIKATGSFDAGSSTTGSMSLTFSGVTAEMLGIKGNCNTTGDAAQTITTSGVFHLITTNTSKPGILLTPVNTTILCIGFSRFELTGNGIIGTITSPACGASSKEMKVSFEAIGSSQAHLTYTGSTYDSSGHTENSAGETIAGESGTAGLSASLTLASSTAGTLECT